MIALLQHHEELSGTEDVTATTMFPTIFRSVRSVRSFMFLLKETQRQDDVMDGHGLFCQPY